MTRTQRQYNYAKKRQSQIDRKRFMEEMQSGYFDDGIWGNSKDHRPLDFSDGYIYDAKTIFNEDRR